MAPLATLDLALVLTAAGFICALVFRNRSRALSIPPGPKGLPLVGNIFDIPSGEHWIKFAEMGDQWGETVVMQRTSSTNDEQVEYLH
jgi:hypothetical protein